MAFTLPIPRLGGEPLTIDIGLGETLFVLGANGTGKSCLLQRFASAATTKVKRISASRQTWFQSSALEFTPSQRETYGRQLSGWDRQINSRWMEQNPQMRSGLTLYDLIDADNVDARTIANTLRSGNVEEAKILAQRIAPIAKINELLALSNIPVEISIHRGDRVMASKNGSSPFGAAELSDGERNALLIAADVLTADEGTLLIIDEPERHLHRSIISPLLTQLFRYRDDCAFAIGTHDLMLPVDNRDARVLLVRSCTFSGSQVNNWDVDLVPANADIGEEIKRDIVGARRRIVFVEGESSSLDKPLYSLLFPGVSVRSKGSSRDVEHTVNGIRASGDLHWLKVWGIIDNDGRDVSSIANLRSNGIFTLPFYSVESIYYHPRFVVGVARRLASVTGEDADSKAGDAIQAAIASADTHLPRLATRAVERAVRQLVFAGMPTFQQIESKRPVSVEIDVEAIVDGELAALSRAVRAGDWTYLIRRCPIRETPALDLIARGIGLTGRYQYEAAVLQMLREVPEMLAVARGMFDDLSTELAVA